MVCDQRRRRDHRGRTTELSETALTSLGMTLLVDHGGDRVTGNRQDGRQSTPA
jgi:hypothetical protein